MPKEEKTSDLMIAFGGDLEVKRQGDIGVVEALGVRFSGPDEPDLEGDYFDAHTDFGPHGGDGVAATLNHRMPLIKSDTKADEAAFLANLSKKFFRNPVKAQKSDMGILVRHVLDLKDEYEKTVFDLAEQGALRWSMVPPWAMVDRDDDGKTALAHCGGLHAYARRAETAAMPAKTWAESMPELRVSRTEGDRPSPEPGTGEAHEERPHKSEPVHVKNDAVDGSQEERSMNEAPEIIKKQDRDELTAEVMKSILNEWRAEAFDPMAERVDRLETLTGQVEEMLKAIQNDSRLEDAGYVTNIGGDADPAHKSFGDFCLAVRRGDVKRLRKVYNTQPDVKSANTKDMLLSQGESGGWLVPNEYATELLRVAGLTIVFSACAHDPVTALPERGPP